MELLKSGGGAQKMLGSPLSWHASSPVTTSTMRDHIPREDKYLEVEICVLQTAVGQPELEGDGVLRQDGEEEEQQQQPMPVLLGSVQDPPVAGCRRPALGVLEPDGVALTHCVTNVGQDQKKKRELD
ncbi:unnamed protein product [Laminaria digitata]